MTVGDKAQPQRGAGGAVQRQQFRYGEAYALDQRVKGARFHHQARDVVAFSGPDTGVGVPSQSNQ